MKVIIVEAESTPETPNEKGQVGMGFNDNLLLTDTDNSGVNNRYTCSACPNCWEPISGKWWDLSYGWLASGKYDAQCIEHPKYNKCILLNNGGIVATRNRNPKHNDKRIMTEVFIHVGGIGKNPEWRGSAGCITLPKKEFDSLMSNFKIGEKLRIVIVDYLKLPYV